MTELGPVAWPPAPIRTERLVLREPEARDRAAVIELLASPEVGTYLGGPRSRDELEREIPEAPSRRPGRFVVALDGAMIGQVTLYKETGHLPQAAGKAELGYLFLPAAWGYGYAAEACAAALGWFADALPGEPVVLATQTANVRSMRLAAKLGFVEVELFEAYGAEQWFGMWSRVAVARSDRDRVVSDTDGRRLPLQQQGRTCGTRPADWYLTEDVDDFLARSGGFLPSRPGPHVMQLTWAERVRARGAEAFGTEAPLFGVLETAGEIHATFYQLPSRGLGSSPLTPEQADSLAVRLASVGHSLPYVSADHTTATAFADAWQRHTGAAANLRDTRLRLYGLGTLTPPEPLPAGRSRVLGEQDLEHVMFWCGEFAKSVGEVVSLDASTWADTRFADKRYTLWETPDGTPVSVAGMNPMIGGQIQVDVVYTPARLRGRGYAGAVTAEVSRAALAAGAKDVVLFADLSNPTSNALYQRLGYRTLTDWSVYDFSCAALPA